MTSKNYADERGALLRELDGLRVEVDAATKVGRLILDRPPLNIVSYRARSQLAARILAAAGHRARNHAGPWREWPARDHPPPQRSPV